MKKMEVIAGILVQFEAMGATRFQLFCEFIKLFFNKGYREEYKRFFTLS